MTATSTTRPATSHPATSRGVDARRRTRNRLYLVGVLPALLLLLVPARIALVLHAESSGQEAFARGDFTEAEEHFAAAGLLNPFERWVSPFDEGVARQLGADLAGAVDAYEDALDHVPEAWECAVRTNLALAHESIGDLALEAGGRVAAEQSWTRGREVLEDCLALDRVSDDDPVEVARHRAGREDAAVIDERLALKLVDARTDPAPVPDPPVPPADTFAEREERLEERELRSLDERRQQQQAEQDREDQPAPDAPPPVPTW